MARLYLLLSLLICCPYFISAQLQFGQTTNTLCTFPNIVSFTFDMPEWPSNIQATSFLFLFLADPVEDMKWDIYVEGNNRMYNILPDSKYTGLGAEIWIPNAPKLTQGTVLTVYLNCSIYSYTPNITITPIIPQDIPASDKTGIYSFAMQDSKYNWFTIPYLSPVISVEPCHSSFFVRIVFPNASQTTEDNYLEENDLCFIDNIFYLNGNENLFGDPFLQKKGIRATWNFSDYVNLPAYMFVVSINFYGVISGVNATATVVNSIIANPVYTQGYLNNFNIFSFQVRDDLLVGSNGNIFLDLASRPDLYSIYVYNDVYEFGSETMCFAHTYGTKYTTKFSLDKTNKKWNGIVASNFFKEYQGYSNFFGAVVVYNDTFVISSISDYSSPIIKTYDSILRYIVYGLSAFGGLLVILIIRQGFKLKERMRMTM